MLNYALQFRPGICSDLVVRKPVSVKLRREKKLKGLIKGVIKRKKRYNAKWKGVITPFKKA